MTIPPNTSQLLELMAQHSLTCAATGKLIGRSAKTVREWRCKTGRVIPDQTLELLELKLEKRAEAVNHG